MQRSDPPIDRERCASIDRKVRQSGANQCHTERAKGYFSHAREQNPSPLARNCGNAELEHRGGAVRGRLPGASVVLCGAFDRVSSVSASIKEGYSDV
jgi:hypothetical protein